MTRQQIIHVLTKTIVSAKRAVPLRVGIDGIDAAGKTSLADELAEQLTKLGHPILRASIDGYHNPKHIRHKRGSYSPEGYYYDSFNYELLQENLLKPLEPTGKRICRISVFDFKTDSESAANEITATDDHILIFEGVFLFRAEILRYWDLKIFVDIEFQTSLERAIERDLYLFGSREEIEKRYNERYIPGQKIYFAEEDPKAKADIIVNNNDFTNPIINIRD